MVANLKTTKTAVFLSLAILSCGPVIPMDEVTYKSALAGSTLVRMDRWYPSTKTCSDCGHKLDELSLSTRYWTCPVCGAEHDRDINAARNMKCVAEQVAWELRETQNARGGERETNAWEGYGSPVEAGNPL